MKIKLMDLVWCNERKLTGQVSRIRKSEVTINFVTGETIKKNLNEVIYLKNHWRIND